MRLAISRSTLCFALFPLVACTTLAPGDEVLIDAGAALLTTMPDAQVEQDADEDGSSIPSTDAALDASQDASSLQQPSDPCPAFDKRTRRILSELEIHSDTRWTCQDDYEIDGYVVVNGGTLTIEPSVRVYARAGAMLVVGRRARIVAEGEKERPIVIAPASHPAQPGFFRGLFMLGSADTALPNNATLGFPSGDARGYFGGDDDTHDCGSLRYLRIEHAGGKADAEDFPAAALTLAGCGTKTRIDSVQVHAATDGIGLVGGTAPLKRVLVTAQQADGIEWTAGYRGFVQFAVVQSFYGANASLKGSQSLSDPSSLPRSLPTIFNATLVGADSPGLPSGARNPTGYEQGLVLQAGTAVVAQNSLFYGLWGGWLDVAGSDAAAAFARTSGATRIGTSIFADGFVRTRPGLPGGGVETGDSEDDDNNFSENAELHKAALQNRFPLAQLTLRAPFVRPPLRPDFSAGDYVEGGAPIDSAPVGWQGVWEEAFFAGALPKARSAGEADADWTAAAWTAFPED